jgi:hypothetical protein
MSNSRWGLAQAHHEVVDAVRTAAEDIESPILAAGQTVSLVIERVQSTDRSPNVLRRLGVARLPVVVERARKALTSLQFYDPLMQDMQSLDGLRPELDCLATFERCFRGVRQVIEHLANDEGRAPNRDGDGA